MNETQMKHYQPTMSLDQNHTLMYTFQYKDAFAYIVTSMSGNVSGGSVMRTEFDVGLTVPVSHELTKKHVIFYDNEDENLPYREVGKLALIYPNGEKVYIDVEHLEYYLVGIQIINYEERVA